jgi:hypothetical protein
LFCLALPAFANNGKTVAKGPFVTSDSHHDTGPLLREIAPLLPEFNPQTYREIDNHEDPRFGEWTNRPYPPDAVLQRPENSPTQQAPAPGLEFDALGFGDSFFCNCMPADNDGAPGTTQYTEFVNTFYAVYSKTGSLELGPLAGDSFWSGFGGGCQNDNWGDPTIRFDAAAQRWVAAQFDLGPSGNGPYAECVAVSTTDDATGSYNRYRFTFTQFPDYPKMGVWPDGYYFSYNINGSSEEVCANDRTAMLAGSAATQVCFTPAGQFGMLPSDLDGPNPPAAGTPNFFVELQRGGGANLAMYNFHADFSIPSNSTFTGPTLIPIAAYKPSCPGATRGACAPQPDAGSDPLETLSDRLMYRLVYRNFGDHSVLLAAHSVQVNATGSGARWYEIHNPETAPTVFQSGTFSPDSQYRFMPAIAMDQAQNIAVGFSRSGAAAGQFPSLVYAGRVPSDPQGTLESEVTMLAGTGSQTSGGFDRWGDYSSLTVDPTDDCTFWFTESYIKSTGQNQGFNWSTGVGNFKFPSCAGGGSPDFSLSASPSSVSVAPGGQGTSTITVNPIDGFNSSVTLSASGMPSGVTAGFNPNPTSTTSLLTLTVPAGTPTGTSTVTITGVSGSLTHQTSLQLTITGGGGPVVTLTPTSLTFAKTVTGKTSAAKAVTMSNTGTATLNITSIVASGDFAISSSTCGSTLAVSKSCKFKVTFTPTQLGTRTGAVTITDNAANSPQSVSLTGTGSAQATLTPAKANFAKTVVGGTSVAKTFTLKNKGTSSLTGISPSTTGDFAVSATTCGSTLAGSGSCTISVVFKPTQTGLRSGALQVNDSAVGSPQVSTLTGTGK